MSYKKIKDNFLGNSIAEELLIVPKMLFHELPLTAQALTNVIQARIFANKIIQGDDKRLLVIVGPCSIHDTQSALEYGSLLAQAAHYFSDDLFLVMRVYFEKPRTTVGWRGLISDPFLNGNFAINSGLRLARKLLLELNELGVPAATEFLDTVIPHYLSDLITWSAIGARTSASQLHRELASGLTMPVGFKNSPDGNVKVAIDAVQVSSQSHQFLSINQDGMPISIRTQGNDCCHIVLRGSHQGPNYEPQDVQRAVKLLQATTLLPRLMIDCSHGNSMKNYRLQHQVADSIVEQIKNGTQEIVGVMLESNLVAGQQIFSEGQALTYGQSITDGCISWQDTLLILEKLASANRQRHT